MQEDEVDIVPISIPARPLALRRDVPHVIGFIAKDFEAKGGHTLLAAYRLVRKVRPDIQLVVAGCSPFVDIEISQRENIIWLGYIERDRLLAEVLPTFDIFAYPTQIDGQPLVVLEALAAGIPVIVSDYQALPEMVDYGKAGLVSPVGNAFVLDSTAPQDGPGLSGNSRPVLCVWICVGVTKERWRRRICWTWSMFAKQRRFDNELLGIRAIY
jgi:glycosyltransferase involved in cell wall biosynthesis